MERRFNFNVHRQGTLSFVVEVSNNCPHCHTISTPNFVNSKSTDPETDNSTSILFQCSNCFKYFALEYEIMPSNIQNRIASLEYVPYTYEPIFDYNFPENISSISPLFKEIYSQSAIAEIQNLNQISGVGYRKALEFLVKDYLINFVKSDEEKIKSSYLGQAIKEIDNHRIKHLATASNWIGTDETHYTRKYEEKDINDLKRFIAALVHFVSSEISAQDAIDMIEQKSQSKSAQ